MSDNTTLPQEFAETNNEHNSPEFVQWDAFGQKVKPCHNDNNMPEFVQWGDDYDVPAETNTFLATYLPRAWNSLNRYPGNEWIVNPYGSVHKDDLLATLQYVIDETYIPPQE